MFRHRAVANRSGMFLLGIVLVACRSNGSASTDSKVRAESNSVQVETVDRANVCVRDVDCHDMGPLCPTQCHVLINSRSPLAADIAFLTAHAREEELTGSCKQDCSGPFFGAICSQGRCRERTNPPGESVCWAPFGTRVNCIEMLRRFNAMSRCASLCDGRLGFRDRFFPLRSELGDGGHTTDNFILDYLQCADCP